MITVGSSLAVALLVPDQAEKIYAVVGATAVCCVCYVVPVYIQLQMHHRNKQKNMGMQVSLHMSFYLHPGMRLQCGCCIMLANLADSSDDAVPTAAVADRSFTTCADNILTGDFVLPNIGDNLTHRHN